MNVAWVKRNLVTIVAIAAFVIVFGLVVWLQRKAAARGQEVEAQLAETHNQLEQSRKTQPFPSQQNVDVLRRDRQQLEQLQVALVEAVSQSNVKAPDLRPVAFSQLLAQKLARLRQATRVANVKIPDDFAFGFSRYVGSLPAATVADEQAKRRIVTQLAKQLLVIEKLTDTLIASGVEEINQIRRVEVDPGASSPEALDAVITADPKALYELVPFELQFVCNTETLRAFLNQVAQSDWFFAVRTVSIKSSGATDEGATAKATDKRLLEVTVRLDLVGFRAAEPKAST